MPTAHTWGLLPALQAGACPAPLTGDRLSWISLASHHPDVNLKSGLQFSVVNLELSPGLADGVRLRQSARNGPS